MILYLQASFHFIINFSMLLRQKLPRKISLGQQILSNTRSHHFHRLFEFFVFSSVERDASSKKCLGPLLGHLVFFFSRSGDEGTRTFLCPAKIVATEVCKLLSRSCQWFITNPFGNLGLSAEAGSEDPA